MLLAQSFKRKASKKINFNYLLYLPEDYAEEGKKFPMVIFLHGAGERGDDIEKVKIHGFPKHISEGKKYDFICVAPQCPEGCWQSLFAKEKNELLPEFVKYLIANYNVDTSKIILTGLSMGGSGTWVLGAKYPKMFSALIPICGEFVLGDDRLENLKDVPVQVFHGARDSVIYLIKSADPVYKLKKMGNKNVKLTIYQDLQHNSWTKAYKSSKLYRWMLAQVNSNFSTEAAF